MIFENKIARNPCFCRIWLFFLNKFLALAGIKGQAEVRRRVAWLGDQFQQEKPDDEYPEEDLLGEDESAEP